MQKWEPQAATAVVAVAAFELWKVWGTTAPTLAEVRSCDKSQADGDHIRQRLLDANITVGSLAIIIGVTLAVLMKDLTALILMLVVFGSLSFFHHWVLASDAI